MKGVGQRFAQRVVEFRDALSKYSIHSDFDFDFVKNDKDCVTIHFKHAKMTSNMIGGLILSEVRNKLLTSNSVVVCDFKDYYGTEVSYRESYDNWHWFLSKLLVILTPGRDIAFVTSRHGDLLKDLAEVFQFFSHSFCLMHLKTNLKTYLSVKSRESKEYLLLLTLFSRCAYPPTIELFNELFEEFKGVVVVFRSFLRICLMSISVTLIFKARDMVKLMDQFSNRREVGNKWNHIVCPFAETKLEEAFNDTNAWIVKKCSDDIYEIQLDYSVMVDIEKRYCSCRL
ncbi:hypothetical protein ACSBR1_032925 [Camellia fascicularis]